MFAGHLLVFKHVEPLAEMAAHVEALIGDAPSPPDSGAIDELKRRVQGDTEVRRLLGAALAGAGVNPARTYWDRIFLRVVPPADGDGGRQLGRLGFHRDTWGSNVLQQVNWWTAIRPLSADRTIAFYPGYWSRPLANTSEDWDLDSIRELKRAGKRSEDIAIVPEPAEPVDTTSELRVVTEPGDLLCFSGAHLHASVPNTSAETRFSVELRTVNADDLAGGRGAPNLDGRAPKVPLHWFRSMADGTPLSPAGDPA